jgi:uncharacterized protein
VRGSLAAVIRRPFSFRSSGCRLRGWMQVPDTSGPHPTIVWVHGSGSTNVDGMGGPGIDGFVEAGNAVVICDQPGCGRSDGAFDPNQSWQERASEVVDAIATLRRHRAVDGGRIGIWGISQAGWVAPMAALRCQHLAFMILVSGPAGTARAQSRYLITENMRLERVSRSKVRQLMAAWERGTAAAMAGAPYRDYLNATAPLRDDPLFRMLGWSKPSRSQYESVVARANEAVDARLLLEQVRCPVLGVFGEKDSLVDWRESRAAYRAALRKSGIPHSAILTFRDANHSLCRCRDGSFREMCEGWKTGHCELPIGYMRAMTRWIASVTHREL